MGVLWSDSRVHLDKLWRDAVHRSVGANKDEVQEKEGAKESKTNSKIRIRPFELTFGVA